MMVSQIINLVATHFVALMLLETRLVSHLRGGPGQDQPQRNDYHEGEQNAVAGFSCANLSCRIVYINEGAPEGFYELERSGELTPYQPD
jgi:hypothetical protein